MKILAVIPAYEPDEHLLELLNNLRASDIEALVVDDGSGDTYKDLFDKAKSFATVLQYEPNGGKGHALKTAFRYLSDNGMTDRILVTMDSDGQHTVKDAIRLCDYVRENPKDIALGSRRMSSKAPLRSRLGNGITRHVFSMASKGNIYDTQSGLRAFDPSMLPFLLGVRGERYEYEMNMLMDASRNEIHVQEIPVETIYFDANKNTHFDALKDSWRIYKEILKFAASSLISFLVDYGIYCLLIALGVFEDYAVIIARIFSASLNFTLNRLLVFNEKEKEKGPLLQSLLKYAALALCMLGANVLLIHLLTQVLHWNPYLSQILVQIVLFITNWLIQRNLVYYKKKKQKKVE